MGLENKSYKDIPLRKIEQLNYLVSRIIKCKKQNQREGKKDKDELQPGKTPIFDVIRLIKESAKSSETYKTGLIGENLMVAAYKIMPIERLQTIQQEISKAIKKQKEIRRQELDCGRLDNAIRNGMDGIDKR